MVSIVTAASARDESPSVQHLGHCARAMIAEALELERLAAPRRRQREAGERASHAAGPASAAVAVRPGIVPAPRPKPRPRSRPVVPVQPAGTLRPPAHPESVRPASRNADHTVVPRPRGAVQPQPPARPAGTASAFAVGTVIGHSRPVRARGTVADLLWPQRMGRVTLTTRQQGPRPPVKGPERPGPRLARASRSRSPVGTSAAAVQEECRQSDTDDDIEDSTEFLLDWGVEVPPHYPGGN